MLAGTSHYPYTSSYHDLSSAKIGIFHLSSKLFFIYFSFYSKERLFSDFFYNRDCPQWLCPQWLLVVFNRKRAVISSVPPASIRRSIKKEVSGGRNDRPPTILEVVGGHLICLPELSSFRSYYISSCCCSKLQSLCRM